MEQSRTEKPAPQPSAPPPAPEMPPLYFERTTAGERARHQEKLARLARQGGMLIEAIGRPDGGCDFEIVTMDWEEPGLLDRIFEAVLRCHRLEHGLSIRHARVFTSARGEVVNILELRDRAGGPLSAESRQTVLQRLGEIRPGERGALETIQNFPYRSLIPLVEDLPVFDNEISDRFTCIRIAAERISNRFTSVLLHFLARSELWLNIQVAEMEQGEKGQYQFYVVDKHGQKLRDSNFLRHSLVGMLEAMNGLVTRFNLYYLQREWQHRLEKNHYTIYHSRPDFDDFLKDIENIRQLSTMKGLGRGMSSLVEAGLLESQSLYFLKRSKPSSTGTWSATAPCANRRQGRATWNCAGNISNTAARPCAFSIRSFSGWWKCRWSIPCFPPAGGWRCSAVPFLLRGMRWTSRNV